MFTLLLPQYRTVLLVRDGICLLHPSHILMTTTIYILFAVGRIIVPVIRYSAEYFKSVIGTALVQINKHDRTVTRNTSKKTSCTEAILDTLLQRHNPATALADYDRDL